jgi:hypothetical protein
MVHGRVIKVCKTPFEVIKYLNDLRAEKYWFFALCFGWFDFVGSNRFTKFEFNIWFT